MSIARLYAVPVRGTFGRESVRLRAVPGCSSPDRSDASRDLLIGLNLPDGGGAAYI